MPGTLTTVSLVSTSCSSVQISFIASYLQKPDALTTGHGAPVDNKTDTLTVGERGQVVLQDVMFLDEMAHFDRERIPERVVHAKGAGELVCMIAITDDMKYIWWSKYLCTHHGHNVEVVTWGEWLKSVFQCIF